MARRASRGAGSQWTAHRRSCPGTEIHHRRTATGARASTAGCAGRFQLVFRRFIGVFARPEHPLALFLDDLQWLDAATLDLLEVLLSRTDVKNLCLIGAYRDNEVHCDPSIDAKAGVNASSGFDTTGYRAGPPEPQRLRATSCRFSPLRTRTRCSACAIDTPKDLW